MIELALHVLDIAENSIRADAALLEITIAEDLVQDRLIIDIQDNGRGMTEEELNKALDPFYSTKKVRRIGLGLPMLSQSCRSSGGDFHIASRPEAGTRVIAEFGHSNIDRQPLGDMAGAIVALILEKPEIDIRYTHRKDSRSYILDTREIRAELGDIPLNHLEVIKLIRDNIREGLAELEERSTSPSPLNLQGS